MIEIKVQLGITKVTIICADFATKQVMNNSVINHKSAKSS